MGFCGIGEWCCGSSVSLSIVPTLRRCYLAWPLFTEWQVLVIGCFSDRGKNLLLRDAVTAAMKKCCTQQQCTAPAVELRGPKDLADFAVDIGLDAKVPPDKAILQFCALDVIVIDGDPTIQVCMWGGGISAPRFCVHRLGCGLTVCACVCACFSLGGKI